MSSDRATSRATCPPWGLKGGQFIYLIRVGVRFVNSPR